MTQPPENTEGPAEVLATAIGAVVPPRDHVERVDLQAEMQRSYLDYAMSVIVSRALPDVRDGLKPVHRRVLYAMYDGGYRPDSSFSKCARVVGDVMGHYHPHGDGAIYDALVRLVQPWAMRVPLVTGQGNFGTPGDLGAAAPRYTECKLAPVAIEMVRDIGKDTVDFVDNYDGRSREPSVLPARYPNLLVNGSEGIAVGMATRIPPHNMIEVAEGVKWFLENPEATKEELLAALMQRIKGPDFPTGATILGTRGIEDMYRTGRGSVTQRAVVEVEELQGRTCLVVTELPYQVNPDRLAEKQIAEGVAAGRLTGIADVRDETSGRAGQRLVIVLKRDAVPKVVLNNLYKHTSLQENFSANMLALVDGVPRTLSLDGFIRHWVNHQIEVIVRRTRYDLADAEAKIHILDGQLKALDALDEVIALIRRSASAEAARTGLMELLDIDQLQADAILAMQLRRLAAMERQELVDRHARLESEILDYRDILARPDRQRSIVGDELAEIVEKHGDERRTTVLPFDGEMSMEDLIPEEDVVFTVTRGGYVKRTRVDNYRAQRRGGKGVRGAQLREDDVIEHFGVTTTHHWLLFFTNLGRVYRAKAYELPEGGRDAKGQHVANVLAMQPGETIAQVVPLRAYDRAEYLVLATQRGLVKKTRLSEYDTPRSGGVIGINLREIDGEVDKVIAARLVNSSDDLLLVSRKGQSLRFTATDETLRPMGRATSGVTGMKFRDGDELLSMDVVRDDSQVFVITEGGFAKRTAVGEYRVQGRGGLGIKVANLVEDRGDLVSALIVDETDEVLVIMNGGKIVRSAVAEVNLTGRNTQGVTFARPDKNDRIIAVARNLETKVDAEVAVEAEGESSSADAGDGAAQTASAAETVASGDSESPAETEVGGES
ncbi:DNA gyrase subunit A [Bogoriella caseilytica]|uniref:DNA topoisomerase (ATP-hydrolyzing) n=1 Tax=Bogoriella caseilytica TaxID=56055 RepID=A0A3N2BCG5_9MICO|nr:DNA gyrase subunit A [Bogoriella caseilytica]